jgi:esterase/lipase
VARGEWDSTSDDRDAACLLSRIRAPEKRDAKIPKGTHLMHLEQSREGLFAAVGDFLKGERA